MKKPVTVTKTMMIALGDTAPLCGHFDCMGRAAYISWIRSEGSGEYVINVGDVGKPILLCQECYDKLED